MTHPHERSDSRLQIARFTGASRSPLLVICYLQPTGSPVGRQSTQMASLSALCLSCPLFGLNNHPP